MKTMFGTCLRSTVNLLLFYCWRDLVSIWLLAFGTAMASLDDLLLGRQRKDAEDEVDDDETA